MKRKPDDDEARPARRRIWPVSLLAAVLGLGTWLGLSLLVPVKLPEDFPGVPDLASHNRALRELLQDADAAARSRPASTADMGRLAMVYHANQFYDQAESVYLIAERLAPDDYRWPYGRALVREETGREKEVLELLQRAAQLNPHYFPALQKIADTCYRQEKLREAARYYELSARAGGKESVLQARFGLARIAARQNEWNRVVEILAEISSEYPHVRPPHQLLLDAYEALGQADKAEAERGHLGEPTLIVVPLLKDPMADDLLSLSCSSTRLLKEAGLLSRFRRPDDAISVARRAAQVAPEDADVHHLLARTLLEARGGDPEAVREALTHLGEGLRLRSDDLLPLWYFATIFFKQKKTDAAVEQLRAMLAANGASAEAHYYLGLVADRQGRKDEAAARYREALRSDPGNAEACHRLGLILVSQGKLDEAVAYFQNAVRLKPSFVLARSNLGVALERQGKIEQAVVQFNEALRVKPNDATTRQYLAIALMRQGKAEQAVLHFREAVRLAPEDAEAHYGLASALMMLRRFDEAKAELEQALELRPDHREARAQLQRLGKLVPG